MLPLIWIYTVCQFPFYGPLGIIRIQVQNTNICSVCLGVLRLNGKTFIMKKTEETKQMAQWRSEAKTQENDKQDYDEVGTKSVHT